MAKKNQLLRQFVLERKLNWKLIARAIFQVLPPFMMWMILFAGIDPLEYQSSGFVDLRNE